MSSALEATSRSPASPYHFRKSGNRRRVSPRWRSPLILDRLLDIRLDPFYRRFRRHFPDMLADHRGGDGLPLDVARRPVAEAADDEAAGDVVELAASARAGDRAVADPAARSHREAKVDGSAAARAIGAVRIVGGVDASAQPAGAGASAAASAAARAIAEAAAAEAVADAAAS